jgi:hypothetical protein
LAVGSPGVPLRDDRRRRVGCLGVVAFARSDFEPGDVIPQGAAGDLRVLNVLEPDRDDELPVLVVELADNASAS